MGARSSATCRRFNPIVATLAYDPISGTSPPPSTDCLLQPHWFLGSNPAWFVRPLQKRPVSSATARLSASTQSIGAEPHRTNHNGTRCSLRSHLLIGLRSLLSKLAFCHVRRVDKAGVAEAAIGWVWVRIKNQTSTSRSFRHESSMQHFQSDCAVHPAAAV